MFIEKKLGNGSQRIVGQASRLSLAGILPAIGLNLKGFAGETPDAAGKMRAPLAVRGFGVFRDQCDRRGNFIFICSSRT